MDELERPKSWFARNWKWVVPGGGCLLIIIAAIVFAGSMIAGISSLFKDSAPYNEAMILAQDDQRVIEQLGTPITKSGTVKGSITVSNNEGHANFDIPINGPKGEAVIYLDATRVEGVWQYSILEVVVEASQDTIKLNRPNETQ